jgi:hypothetical protein
VNNFSGVQEVRKMPCILFENIKHMTGGYTEWEGFICYVFEKTPDYE